MTEAQLQALITALFPGSIVQIGGDGHHFEATIVSDHFAGLSKLKRQQLVYAGVAEYIKSGALHALNLNTYTNDEWKQKNG